MKTIKQKAKEEAKSLEIAMHFKEFNKIKHKEAVERNPEIEDSINKDLRKMVEKYERSNDISKELLI